MSVSMQLEMMSDAIDETFDKDEAEEETEELTNQVTQSFQTPACEEFCFDFHLTMKIHQLYTDLSYHPPSVGYAGP